MMHGRKNIKLTFSLLYLSLYHYVADEVATEEVCFSVLLF